MRFVVSLLFCLLFSGLILAQDDLSPYETALQRIEEAQTSGVVTLDLSRLGLDSLPPEIGQLVGLESLSLRGNQLSSLPSEIGQLVNLEMLDVSQNQLSSLPPEIDNLYNLCLLNLLDNPLTIERLPNGIDPLPGWENPDCGTNETAYSAYGGVIGQSGLLLSADQRNPPFWVRQSFILPALVAGIGVSAAILFIFWRRRRQQRA